MTSKSGPEDLSDVTASPDAHEVVSQIQPVHGLAGLSPIQKEMVGFMLEGVADATMVEVLKLNADDPDDTVEAHLARICEILEIDKAAVDKRAAITEAFPVLAKEDRYREQRLLSRSGRPSDEVLSETERDILALVGIGKKVTEIALELDLQDSTVRTKIRSANRKITKSNT